MLMKKFELIEHTADIGMRIFGRSREGLFENAARALISLITDYHPRVTEERTAQFSSETLEDLFIAWLSELIGQLFAESFLPSGFDIYLEEEKKHIWLRTKMLGGHFDPFKQKIKMEVKAATYHNLKIEKTDKGWVAEVIFDV
jgi:SHS2 domain-containing protein